MTVKESIQQELKALSKNEHVVFLGENVINSGRIYGCLDEVPINRCIEMPVAENLIAGCGIGLVLSGYLPIVVFQRMDFMLIAADAIINHAALMPKMTGVKISIVFITFKATLNEKFYAGLQHTKDLSHVFQPYMNVYEIPTNIPEIISDFTKVHQPILLVIDHESLNNAL